MKPPPLPVVREELCFCLFHFIAFTYMQRSTLGYYYFCLPNFPMRSCDVTNLPIQGTCNAANHALPVRAYAFHCLTGSLLWHSYSLISPLLYTVSFLNWCLNSKPPLLWNAVTRVITSVVFFSACYLYQVHLRWGIPTHPRPTRHPRTILKRSY